MPFQPVGNAAEIAVRGSLDGQECVNTIGVLGSVGWGQTDLSDLCTIVRDIWDTSFLPIITSAYTAIEVVGRGLRTESDFDADAQFDATSDGQADGFPMPNNVTIAVSFRTGLVGRSYRGRNYWPGLTSTQVAGNTVLTAHITAMRAAYSALRTAINETEVWVMGVISRVQEGVVLESGIVTPITTFAVADATIDSQRRRLPGRGN